MWLKHVRGICVTPTSCHYQWDPQERYAGQSHQPCPILCSRIYGGSDGTKYRRSTLNRNASTKQRTLFPLRARTPRLGEIIQFLYVINSSDQHSNLQCALHEAQRGFSAEFIKRQQTLAAAGAYHRWATLDVCRGWCTTSTSTRQTIIKTQMGFPFCGEVGVFHLALWDHPTADMGCRGMRRKIL